MKATRLILSLLGATALAATALATLVTLDTSALAGGTYYVDFQFNDGSGLGNGNNTALIRNFNFGGGAATGSPTIFGGVTGNLFTSVALTDTDPLSSEFYQSFTAGSFLSFDLQLSDNPNAPVPDIFGFALLDGSFFNLPTFSPGSDQFLTVELNGTGLTFQTFGGVDGVPPPTAVPEAGSTALFVSVAALGLAIVRRRLARPPLTA